jgi:pilus assembly protein Flp/PilA
MPSSVALDAEWTHHSSGWRQAVIKSLKIFVADAVGATAIEYALIASLIAVFIIGSLQVLGASLSSEFTEVSNALH